MGRIINEEYYSLEKRKIKWESTDGWYDITGVVLRYNSENEKQLFASFIHIFVFSFRLEKQR
jgi:hypothetical protein